MILRPFVPFSRADERTELQAYMTASSDPESYGQLTAYVLPNRRRGAGVGVQPHRLRAVIAQQITLQAGGGNTVRFGDLQIVPTGRGLLWVRPFYASVAQGTSGGGDNVTEYRFVIVSYNDRAVFGESLGEALAKLFPGYEGDLGDRVGADSDAPRGAGGGASRRRAPGPRSWRAPTSCCRRPRPRWTRPTWPSTRRRSTRRRR